VPVRRHVDTEFDLHRWVFQFQLTVLYRSAVVKRGYNLLSVLFAQFLCNPIATGAASIFHWSDQ